MRFPISFQLINLLRKPEINLENHIYQEDFKSRLKTAMSKYSAASFTASSNIKLTEGTSVNHIVLYTHLALSMSFNLENLFTLYNLPTPEPLSKDINSTNIVNVWSLDDVIQKTKSTKE